MPDDAIERARDVEERTMICVNDIHALATQLATGSIMPAMFRRKTFARLLAFASQQAPSDRTWTPHFDYAGEPMREGHFRDPPEGWVLVPRDLPNEMLEAGQMAVIPPCSGDLIETIWSAMLDAAPSVTLGEVG